MGKALAVAAVAIGGLSVWRGIYHESCTPLVIPAAFAIVVGMQLARISWFRRSSFAHAVFIPQSWLHRFFSGRAVSLLIAASVASVSVAVLFLNAISWPVSIMVLLAVDAVALALLAPRTRGWQRFGLRPEVSELGAQHVLVQVNPMVLLAIVLAVQFVSPFPEFVDRGLSLARTLERAGSAWGSSCDATEVALRLQGLKEGFSWWLVLKGAVATGGGWHMVSAWLLVLVSGAISLWAYSRAVVELAVLGLKGERS